MNERPAQRHARRLRPVIGLVDGHLLARVRRWPRMLDSLPAATSRRGRRWCWPTTAPPTAVSRPRPQRPGVRLLRTGGNLGYGAAANAGVRGARPGDRAGWW